MKNNAYYIKSHILNYINKRKYSSAKNLINLLYLNERKKGVYSYVKDLIIYLLKKNIIIKLMRISINIFMKL